MAKRQNRSPSSAAGANAGTLIVQMPRMQWAACLWPGLPHLWRRGSWAGLAVAVGFTALTNVLLLATLVFDEWMVGKTRWMVASTWAVVWLLAWWESRDLRRDDSPVADESRDAFGAAEPTRHDDLLFCEAQRRYLAGDWIATERLLLKLLKQDARDVESRLMLATLWRHQGRDAEALRQLDRLERLEPAKKWKQEIKTQRKAINQRSDAPLERQERTTQESSNNPSNSNKPNGRLAA